jgi:branched-chain amino acid transport system substrate-binding protein
VAPSRCPESLRARVGAPHATTEAISQPRFRKVAVRFPLYLVVMALVAAGCSSVSMRRGGVAPPPAAAKPGTAPTASPTPGPAATAKPGAASTAKPAAPPAVPPGAAAATANAGTATAAAAKPARRPGATPAPAGPDTLGLEDTAPATAARLGLLAPLTGRYAAYGKAYLDGARAAASEWNARAKRRVEIVPADCSSEPLPALQATRKLVEGAGVVALVGSVLNAPTLVAAMEANCRGVPLVSNVATEDGIAGVGPWVFHMTPSRHAAARAGADLAVLHLRRFRAAVVYPDAGDGRALALAFGERFAELGGDVVLSEPYAAETRDFSPIARRVADTKADLLYAPAEADDWMLLSPALAFHGVTAETQILGGEDLADAELLRAHGADLEGAVLPAPDRNDAPQPPAGAARAARSPTEQRLAGAGYAATRQVLAALGRSALEDREALRAALRAAADADSVQAPLARRFLVVRQGRVQPLAAP